MINLNKEQLNIIERTRTSILPWRGQFSPELVEYLIDTVCMDSKFLYDPFCGSGTVLLESILKGRSALGSEVNPAAWYLSSLVSLSIISRDEKNILLNKLSEIISFEDSHIILLDKIKDVRSSFYEVIFFSCCIILGMKNSNNFSRDSIRKGALIVSKVLSSLPDAISNSNCVLEDARKTSLKNDSVDGVITSPPYINVFNYHQNYRPAIELLGWKPLDAAKSEIGANRKHRQNRFLTVVQYCLDMSQVLDEICRVTVTNSPVVLVVGRESNVLGIPFKNSELIKDIISKRDDLEIIQMNERKFLNMYGKHIYEDVIISKKINNGFDDNNIDNARAIGVEAIKNAMNNATDEHFELLKNVIEKSELILPSSFLNISAPDYIKGF